MLNPTSEAHINIVLHDGTSVSKEFYDSIRLQVEPIIPALEFGERYTLEMLCGLDFWEPLSDGKRRLAGKCMVHIVENGLIPSLSFAKSRHEYPQYYQLRDPI